MHKLEIFPFEQHQYNKFCSVLFCRGNVVRKSSYLKLECGKCKSLLFFSIRKNANIHSHFAAVFSELKLPLWKSTNSFHFWAVIVPNASKGHLRTRYTWVRANPFHMSNSTRGLPPECKKIPQCLISGPKVTKDLLPKDINDNKDTCSAHMYKVRRGGCGNCSSRGMESKGTMEQHCQDMTHSSSDCNYQNTRERQHTWVNRQCHTPRASM